MNRNTNRKKMILKASFISAFVFFLQGILNIIRTGYIIKIYGSSINGVISLSQQIFNYLVLLESGLGAAYLYKMYEPMAKKNYKKVKALFLGLTKSLKKIAVSMFIIMALISIIYPLIINKESLTYLQITIILLLLGIRFIIPYYLTINQKNLLYIYEEKYIVDFIDGIANSIIILIEIILMKVYSVNIIFVLLLGIIGVLIINYIYTIVLKKRCNEVLIEDSNPSFEGQTMTKDIVIHQISSVVFSSTDNIILSIFDTLNSVTIYSAYNTILTYPTTLINKIIDNLRATFGKKMINDEKNTIKLFYETLSFTLFLATFLAPLFYILINDFISLWIGSSFTLNKYCIIIWTLLFIHRIIMPVIYVLRDSKGLYKESKYYTLTQAIANIIISLILIKSLGILGLLIGTIISTYMILIPCNYILVSKKILHEKTKLFKYLGTTLIYVMFIIVIIAKINILLFSSYSLNWFNFIFKALIDVCLVLPISLSLLLLNSNFRNLIKRFLPNKMNKK